MIPTDVLDQLRDIQTPPPAGFWPPAPGWWLLAALLVATAAFLLFISWRRYRRHAPKRQALARLARYPVPAANADPGWYAGLNQLLKETALSRYPEANPTRLSGAQWSRFLAQTSGVPDRPWHQLVMASYQPRCELAPVDAARLAEQWIRRQPW